MSEIERRKQEHMDLAASDAATGVRSAGWDDVALVPTSVPDVSLAEIDRSTIFLGHRLTAPILIAGMTGGHDGALEINRRLARAAARLGLAIGVGSQRAALLNPELEPTYRVVRDEAPDAVVVANLGMCQLVEQGDEPAFGPRQIRAVIDMVGADLLAIHLNALEELIQPEGDRNVSNLSAAIARVVDWSPVPVIAKETGAGVSREAAIGLAACGVAAIDVGGTGSTSFARIEAARAGTTGDRRGSRLGATFADWGIPTAASLVEAASAGLPLIATGGIHDGLHAAKALALGATVVGIGRVAVSAARLGAEALIEELGILLEELSVAMVLTGTHRVRDLNKNEPVITGRTAEWLHARRLP
jgi:isopentenyl-diphosphate delta-isomerase